jgi:hypothetical protein
MSMADIMDLFYVVLGGSVATVGSIVTYYMRAKRDDKLRKEACEREDLLRDRELKERRMCDAHEYFQNHVEAFKPFLVAYTKLDSLEIATKIRPYESRLREYETRDAHKRLRETIESLNKATNTLIDEGYAALFPKKLYNSITQIRKDLHVFEDYIDEGIFPVLDEYEQIVLRRIIDNLSFLREQIRFLINVDALMD